MARRRHIQALGPRTRKNYQRIIERAYGPEARLPFPREIPAHVLKWPESSKAQLRSAIVRLYTEAGQRDAGEDLASRVPGTFTVKRLRVDLPPEVLDRVEAHVLGLDPKARALVMIPLRLGLRAEELLGLPREAVEQALATNLLTFVRKGAKEARLPVDKIREVLTEALAVPAAPKHRIDARGKAPKPWRVLGEVLAGSHATLATRYNLLNRLVHRVGAAVGYPKLRPHLLRHGFATRLHADGAPIRVIQEALGHESVVTTERYVHVGVADIRKWLR